MRTQSVPTEHSGITSTADLFCLRHTEVDAAWPEVKPLLERVLAQGVVDWTVEDVYYALTSKAALLWGLKELDRITGIWITRIEGNHRKLWGLVWIAAGEGLERGLDEFRSRTEPYFAAWGCEFISIVGRRGWKKLLPDYESSEVRLVKRLKS